VRPASGVGDEIRTCLRRYAKLLGEASGNLARGMQSITFQLPNGPDRATYLTRQLILGQVERLAPPLQPPTE
jgi:hypothetical protein